MMERLSATNHNSNSNTSQKFETREGKCDAPMGFQNEKLNQQLTAIYNNKLNTEPAANKTTTTRFLCIRGPLGSGKSTLARSLASVVQQHSTDTTNEYFVYGRFDNIGVQAPFVAFVQALSELATAISARRDDLARVRDHPIIKDGTCAVLTEIIPKLQVLLRGGASSSSSSSSDMKTPTWKGNTRFLYAFRALLKVLRAALQSKFVLCLDDVQYADPCSLELLSSLIHEDDDGGDQNNDDNKMNEMLIVACLDSNTSTTFMNKELCQGNRFQFIDLAYPTTDDVFVMLSNLDLDRSEQTQLADLLHSTTRGNFIYLNEILVSLRAFEDNNILKHAGDLCLQSMDQLMTKRVLGALTEAALQLLKVASVFGSSIDQYLLSKAVGDDKKTVACILTLCEDRSIVQHVGAQFEFLHPNLQKVIYNLVPQDEKEIFHLEIGRQLWRNFGPADLDLYSFHVLSQYRLGRKHICKENEIRAVASLCLSAGRKAAKACTFRMAANYLEFGIELLGGQGWSTSYALTLNLYNAAAEVNLCSSNYEKMNQLLDVIFVHAKSLEDQIQAHTTKIYYLGVIDKPEEAIGLGIHVLSQLGERLPSKFHLLHTVWEFIKARRLVKKKSDQQLLRSPPLTDTNKLARLHILQLIYLYAMLCNSRITPLIQLRMFRITLRDGFSAFSSTAFVSFGILNIAIARDYVNGVRFGQLAIELLEKYEAIEYVPRVYLFYYGMLHGWKYPNTECLAPLFKAYEIGEQTGDIEFSAFCATTYCMMAMAYGPKLSDIADQWIFFQQKFVNRRQSAMLNLAMPAMTNVFIYAGLSLDRLECYEMPERVATPQDSDFQERNWRMAKLMRHCIMTENEEAFRNRLSKKDFMLVPPSFLLFELHFVSCMVYTALAISDHRHRGLLRAARKHLKEMDRISSLTPENALAKCHLVEAQIASLSGQNDRAHAKYVCAISLSESKGMFMYGFSNEHAARHYIAMGDTATANQYVIQACQGYERWGAHAKLERFVSEMQTVLTVPDWKTSSSVRN